MKGGFVAAGSVICVGASSSQSSGFEAAGSSIFGVSTQSSGFLSYGSSISFGGLIGGLKSVSLSKDATFFSTLSTRIFTLLSTPTIAV